MTSAGALIVQYVADVDLEVHAVYAAHAPGLVLSRATRAELQTSSSVALGDVRLALSAWKDGSPQRG